MGMGHALAARLDHRDYHVYVMIGDGESDEGQIWEAALAGAKYELQNLTVIVDNNQFQQTGPVKQVMPSLLPIIEKWRAMGWHVQEADGHDMAQVVQVLRIAQAVRGQPQAIIAHTKKGKGLSVFEKDNVSRKHGVALTPDEAKGALAELDRMYGH